MVVAGCGVMADGRGLVVAGCDVVVAGHGTVVAGCFLVVAGHVVVVVAHTSLCHMQHWSAAQCLQY